MKYPQLRRASWLVGKQLILFLWQLIQALLVVQALNYMMNTINIFVLEVEFIPKNMIELLKLFSLNRKVKYISSNEIEAAFVHRC